MKLVYCRTKLAWHFKCWLSGKNWMIQMSPSSRLGPLLGRIITVGCWCWYLFTRAAAARLLRKNSLLTPGQSAHHLSAAGGRLVLAVARPWRVWTKIKKITRTFLLHSLLSPAQRSLSLNVNLQNSSSGQHKMCFLKISEKKIICFALYTWMLS